MSYHLRSEHVRVNLLMMNWRTCLVMFCDQISRCLIIDENLETCHNTSSQKNASDSRLRRRNNLLNIGHFVKRQLVDR